MNSRISAKRRAVLLTVCIAALLVMPAATRPVAARTPQAPSGPDVLPVRLFLPLVAQPGPPQTSFDLIEQAMAGGTLDDVTALVYKVYATFGDPRLPAQYRGQDPTVRGGTQVLAEAGERYASLPPATQAILRPFLIPPQYEGSWDDQQPATGAAVAAAAAGAASAAVPAGDVPPGEIISSRWFWKGNDVVKVWGRKDRPDDQRLADLVLAAVKDDVWSKLTALMKRVPIKDDGQKDFGGDGRLDITLTNIADDGETTTYSHKCIMGPAFMRVKRKLSDVDLRATVAHEFMHVLQFTYDFKGGCTESAWLAESTATWAEDYVYPISDTEQFYLKDFLDHPGTPLDDDTGLHEYGDYLFPFYLSHRYTPDVIRQMWAATETTAGILAAVDSVLDGGFKKQWPEFARYNWNRAPQDDYLRWDDVMRGVKVADTRVPEALVPLFVLDFDMNLAADVHRLAAKYYHFVFPQEDARSIALYIPFYLTKDPAANVQALVKIGGAWQPALDLTDSPGQTWCRDTRAERIEELVLIFSNSNWEDPNHVLAPYFPPRLVATNVGCYRWKGTAKGTYVTKGSWTSTTEAQLTFERYHDPAHPASSLKGEEYYPIAGGQATWRMTTVPGALCSWDGGPTTFPIGHDDASLDIMNYVTTPPQYRRSYLAGGIANRVFDYTITCDGSSTPMTWNGSLWMATSLDEVHVSDDGQTIDATRVDEDNSQHSLTYEWHFQAEREP